MGPLCPTSVYGSPAALLKFPMAPRLIPLMSSGSKEEEPRYVCLSEATASHSHRMWAAPHLLHSGLSVRPISWRCLLRVLCPVRKPVTALDCILLKDTNLALAHKQGPEISSQVCLWALSIIAHSKRTGYHIVTKHACGKTLEVLERYLDRISTQIIVWNRPA
jgi:hypothetical protein